MLGQSRPANRAECINYLETPPRRGFCWVRQAWAQSCKSEFPVNTGYGEGQTVDKYRRLHNINYGDLATLAAIVALALLECRRLHARRAPSK
jgi:hypothetical protein